MRYYLHVLNHKKKSYININLTEEESVKYEKYDNLRDFIKYEKIGEKYGFDIKKSDCMITTKNKIYYKI